MAKLPLAALVASAFVSQGCAGTERKPDTAESPPPAATARAPAAESAPPAPSEDKPEAVPENCQAKHHGGACFPSVEAACDVLKCPDNQCSTSGSLPPIVTCEFDDLIGPPKKPHSK